ncbi:hypothetical protein MPSEU_000956500 [Mayamaea pseudoterrestris]|nr:hypothetical protein MPSEU_000956500 [Mayamaea pseudoterrestris]
MAPPNEIRNRKTSTNNKKKQKDSSSNNATAAARRTSSTTTTRETSPREPETLWETFKTHPFVVAAPYILIPYFLYKLGLLILLRRPDIFRGLLELRPAVRMNETRQVLILGAIGSGTKQVTEGLSKVMKLELAHEGTNSLEQFTRDGTVSNFLGIRYAPTSYSRERLSSMLSNTCLTKTKASGSVFSLTNYKPTDCWPWPINNQTCRQRECLQFVGSELGCGLNNACTTPFARVIHLVRHPIHVLQQLVPKLCPGNITATKAVYPAFRQMAGVFVSNEGDSLCVASLAWYLVEYNRAMIDARKQKHIHAMLQYESLSLCQLALAAGFGDVDTAIYASTVDKVQRLCHSDESAPTDSKATDAHQSLPHLETKSSDPTMKLATLSWNDFDAVGGTALVRALKDLCRDLEYDPDAPFVHAVADENTATTTDEKVLI